MGGLLAKLLFGPENLGLTRLNFNMLLQSIYVSLSATQARKIGILKKSQGKLKL